MLVNKRRSSTHGAWAALLSAFFWAGLLFLTGALLRPLTGNADPFASAFRTYQETISVQIIGSFIFVISVAIVLGRAARLRINRELLLTSALLGLALASATWSDDPGLSIRRSAALAGTAAFGLSLALSYDQQKLLLILNRFGALFILFNFALAIILPSYSFYQQAGYSGLVFSGSFTQKNDFAHVLGLCLVVLMTTGMKYTRLSLFYIVVGAGLIFATRSAGSIVALIFAQVAVYVTGVLDSIRSPKYRMFAYVIQAFFLAFLMALFSIVGASELFGLLGRDTTLSDRTLIWPLLVEAGKETWLLGAGYGVVWTGATANVLKYGSIHNAHNGYLETWLNLGAVGLTLVLALMALSWRNLRSMLKNTGNDLFARTSLGIIAYIVMANIVSARLVAYNDITWALLIMFCYLSNVRRSPSESKVSMVARPRLYAPVPKRLKRQLDGWLPSIDK